MPPTIPPRLVINLEYAPPPRVRPGLVTATGVLSIIFGGLGVFSNGMAVLQMVGFYFLSRAMPTGGTRTVITSAGTPTTVPVASPFAHMRLWPMAVYGVASLLCVALAVYLLVAGITLLRDGRRGRSLHLSYAVMKFPAAMLVGLGYGLWFSDFLRSAAASAPSTSSAPPTFVFWLMAAAWALVGCLYPIALLIVLHTRRIREYCAGLSATAM